MCRPASFVLTKDKVYWSEKSDSHEDIIDEFGLTKLDRLPEPQLLRVEIAPLDNDYSLPARQWVFKIDQDILPAWHDLTRDRRRTRKALAQWSKSKVVTDGEVIKDLRSYKAVAYGNARVTVNQGGKLGNACGNARVTLNQGGKLGNACGNARVTVNEGGELCYAYDNARVTLNQGGEIWDAFGNARVTLNQGGKLGYACGNARVTVNQGGKLGYAYGNARVTVNEGGELGNAHGNARVTVNEGGKLWHACGNARVTVK